MIEYRQWEGKLPHVILLSGNDIQDVLYYETGFEQLHPIPPIHDWMSERGYVYRRTWNCVSATPMKEWALCFADKEICELFIMKWL